MKLAFNEKFPPLAGVRIVVDLYVPEDTMYAIATGPVDPRAMEGMSDEERFVYLAAHGYVAMAKNLADRLAKETQAR